MRKKKLKKSKKKKPGGMNQKVLTSRRIEKRETTRCNSEQAKKR